MLQRLTNLRLYLLQYRRHIAALTAALLCWGVINGFHKGQPILLAGQPLAAGIPLQSQQLVTAYLDAPSTAGYVTDVKQVAGKSLLRSLAANQPILLNDLQVGSAATSRVIVDLPLDAGAGADYQTGTDVHVWAVNDEGTWQLSDDAVVLGVLGGQLGSSRVLLSLPKSAEAAAMTANAVRLAVVSRG